MIPRPTILRIGTHNVRGGLVNRQNSVLKAQHLATFWKAQQLDIIFIQEHKVTNFFNIHRLSHGPLRDYQAFFNPNRSQNGLPSCAILIKRRLITSKIITIQENSKVIAPNGRLLSLIATWGGHRLQLACIHLPCESAAQREFIDTHLVPLASASAAGGSSQLKRIWGGDFNFVHNPSLDKIQRVTNDGVTLLQRPTATTSPVGTYWSTVFSNLLDIYRHRYPTSRDMSRYDPVSTSVGHGGSSRLDRFYISETLASASPHSRPCTTTIVPDMTFSDHLLVTMSLVARSASSPPSYSSTTHDPPRWRKRRRYKILFNFNAALVDKYNSKLTILINQAPLDARQLLDWYPTFKQEWVKLVVAMNQKYWSLRNAAPAHDTAALQQAFTQLQSAPNAELSTALDTYMAAHQAHTAAARVHNANHAALLARFNIHENEFPNKNLTQWIAPCSHITIQAIKCSSGSLVTNPVRCATIFAKNFAAVSRLPTTNQAAQQQVLLQIEQSSLPKISEEEAAMLGSGTVTTAEVASAIKHTRAGTSPGPDGIPIGFYHLSRRLIAPLLAKVYSASHSLDDAPLSFSLGAYSPLYKLTAIEGDITDSKLFRPITLLDVDYRLIAKVLAIRTKPLLPKIIHPSQSAFILGRNISDCNWLPQFLAPLLERTGQSAAFLLCDIAKAYDTVDREFLWQVMALMGVGDDYLKWIKLLHRNTKAYAVVRGYLGDTAKILAGVRQGCPLAALLFSFITHALLLFLEPLQIGIKVNNELISNSLFADDLRAVATLFQNYQCPQATQLLEALVIFGDASNLRPSVPKLESLLLGAIPATIPPSITSIGAFKLVPQARSLGLHLIHGAGLPLNVEESIIAKFKSRCKLISQCGLSMFGRSSALSGYCNSVTFYVAEFAGLPNQATLDDLAKATSKLINRNVAPNAPGRGFYGIKTAELAGRPTDGGFGLIPLESHILARHAKACLRLLTEQTDVTWLIVGRQLLALTSPHQAHSGNNSRLAAVSSMTFPNPNSLPSPLSWLLQALYQLPPLVVDPELEPGPWCYSIPLWNNKFILAATPGTDAPPRASLEQLDQAAGFYSIVSSLHTIGDALVCFGRLSAIPEATSHTHQLYTAVANDCFGPATAGVWTNPGPSGLPELGIAKPRLKALLKCIRLDWLRAAQTLLLADEHLTSPSPKPSMEEAIAVLLTHLGWKYNKKFLSTSNYTVKWGTRQHFETTAAFTAQLTKFQNYAQLADSSGTHSTRLKRLYAAFKRAWPLRWDRKHTQLLWQLAHNALPTAARLHTTEACFCCPSTLTPGLIHHFWECPVALGIRNELWHQVSNWEGFTRHSIRRHHLWLLECPSPTFFKPLWPVVALAALNAMDSGRRTLFRSSRNSPAAASIPTIRRAAIRNATAAFWKLIAHFTATSPHPSIWSSLAADHPIIHWNPTTAKLELSTRLL